MTALEKKSAEHQLLVTTVEIFQSGPKMNLWKVKKGVTTWIVFD